MSSWGNLDNVAAAGTVYVATANANAVLGVSTYFTVNVKAGDYITIASNKYQVEQVVSNTVIYLTSAAATDSAGVAAYIQQGPKYVSNVSTVQNTYTIQNIYGVDRVEVEVTENKNRNFSQPGWTHYNTYTTEQGETRYKTEVLVAMSKNFASNADSALFGTGAGTDASDDTVLADYRLLFSTQPADASNTAGNSVVFLSVAASDPTGATLAYQWYKRDNVNDATYAIVPDGLGISGNTTNTLTITNVANVDGNIFRLTVSTTDGGADSINSTAVTADMA
jgi:hypothetical protein